MAEFLEIDCKENDRYAINLALVASIVGKGDGTSIYFADDSGWTTDEPYQSVMSRIRNGKLALEVKE
jgi:hypothetical protein